MEMSVRKNILKILIFALLFMLIWMILQSFLAYNWNRLELMTSRYEDYGSEDEGSIDAIFLGPSTTYADIAPAALWDSSGITSYNMGTSNQIPILSYYEFLYLMKLNKPKVVVLDFSAISLDMDVDEDPEKESIYRRMPATMPDKEIKRQMIDEICSRFESQKKLSYYLPLIRHHDRWDELTEWDFSKKKVDELYEPWTKGGAQNSSHEAFDWPENFFNTENNEAVPDYEEYYQKIVDICNENDIEVLVFLAPKLALRPGDYKSAAAFAEKNQLNILTLASQKSMESVGLDPAEDFYDKSHLNVKGQKKLSEVMGRVLQSYFSLPGHKGEAGFEKWSEFSKEYEVKYKELVEEMD